MTRRRLIAVVGATGSQGGALARAILLDPDHEFALRAVTRNAGSAHAQKLARAGAEVIAADLDDKASMRAAFDGAYGAYVVTNYFAQRSPEDWAAPTTGQMNLAQAEIVARAARDAGVAHAIWATLDDIRTHFGDANAEADEPFVRYGVPTTFLRTTFFSNNIAEGMGLERDASGQLVLTLPLADQSLCAIAVDDLGKSALGIFKLGQELIGETVSIAGHQVAEDWPALHRADMAVP